MSEENIDLSAFDDIPDRATRAKAKAEAIRKARAAAGGKGPSKKPAAKPAEEAAEEPVAETVAEGGEGEEVDLSALNEITDRVARAKAKAEAIRKARGGDGAPGGGGPPAKKETAGKAASTADRAAAARALTSKTKEAVAEREVIVQTSPAPPAIRPGPERTMPVAEGGMTTRRGFFSWLTLAWVSFSTASAAGLAGLGRFLFPNVLFEPPQSFKIGYPEDYDLGVDERWKDKFGVWVVKTREDMFALISVCTHLGCTPNWLSGEQKFKCPCHGSGFYSSGINFEGPAPRPLERAAIVLAEDGQILVDKNRKYQYEKGQWELPEARLAI